MAPGFYKFLYVDIKIDILKVSHVKMATHCVSCYVYF